MNWKSVFNPFERFDEKLLLLIGVLAVVASIAAGYWTNSAFTSIYKISVIENVSLQNIILSTLFSFLIAIVVLFILGKSLNKKTRIIDIINTVLISQLFLIPLQYLGKMSSMKIVRKNIIRYESDPSGTFLFMDFLIMISISIISITILIYSFTLFYNGFKTATNIKKWQHVVLFCFVSLVSTLLCQILITKII